MPGVKQTRDRYDRFVTAWRREGTANGVAVSLGCTWETAKRVYEKGWAKKPFARPIKEILLEERNRQQARAQNLEEKHYKSQLGDADKAKDYIQEARDQEQQILRLVRHDVLIAQAAVAKLSAPIQMIAEHLNNLLASGLAEVDLELGLKIIGTYTRITKQAAGAADTVIRLSRLDRGATTEHVGIGKIEEELTIEEALYEIAQANSLTAKLELQRDPKQIVIDAHIEETEK